MGKTYEALERAEKEYLASRPPTAPKLPFQRRDSGPKRLASCEDMESYEELKTSLVARYPDGSIKAILFAGSADGNGVSTAAVNFAMSVARDSQAGVLLVDANLRSPSLHSLFKVDRVHGFPDQINNDGELIAPLIETGRGNLYVLPCSEGPCDPVAFFESHQFGKFLKAMRERFDYVILDAPPVYGFPECLVLSSKVDGVILVIESGRTRQQAAVRAKTQLEEAGGTLLGVVLNKRKYYIPEFIYKRL